MTTPIYYTINLLLGGLPNKETQALSQAGWSSCYKGVLVIKELAMRFLHIRPPKLDSSPLIFHIFHSPIFFIRTMQYC